jgi:CheY-like chemotaxis protein
MHLLYVDDDRINLMLFESACAALAGLRLSTAASGAEALELARADPPQLLVIDLHLPDTDGHALLHALRRDAALP